MMISISTNDRKRRIRRRDNMMESSQTSFHAPSSLLILLALLLSTNITIPILSVVSAKEIVATNEWQLLKENDTIPSGLHVRMDLSTGEKWVKLVTDDDVDEEYDSNNKGVVYNDNDDNEGSKGVQSAVMDVNGALSIVEESSAQDDDNNNNNKGEKEEEDASTTTGKKDYNMMHRVMSKLPPEELEKYGGLPSLPELSSSSNASNNTPSSPSSSRIDNLTPPQRLHFEQRMEEIWNKRQIELQTNMNEQVADLPSILKLRIDVIKDYISNSYEKLSGIMVERRKKKTAETDVLDGEEDEEGDEVLVADNIITALQDLEYQLSDVDMSRDFHTLGGWSYLVALLDDSVHTLTSVQEGKEEKEDNEEEMAILVDEIQALAAMTIGTAVSNCGEFHVWALEDVSSVLDTIRIKDEQQQQQPSALSLLISSFENELTLRTQNMADGSSTMAIPTQSNAKYKSRATYKLRAIYALGSILRGNPLAQQYFVQNNGSSILVHNVLGTLSNVRGPSIMNDISLVKLDYKFASKVLALGQDVVMDVVLHEDAYVKEEESTALTASQLVGSFTTEQWCDLSLRMLVPPSDKIGSVASRGMKERAIHAIRALGPGCSIHQSDTVSSSWGVEEVKKVRSEWNREGSDDGIDSVYRKELLDLVDSVLEVLIDEQ